MSFVTSARGRRRKPRSRERSTPLCRTGGMSRLRRQPLHHARLRVQHPYEQAFFDKSIVLACCIAAAMGLVVDARLVAAFCLGVIATSLAEVAQETAPAVQRDRELPFPSSRQFSYRRLCRLRLSLSMTSRDACAVNASGPRWRLAPCLSARFLADLRGGALTLRTLLADRHPFRSPPPCYRYAPLSWSANRAHASHPRQAAERAPRARRAATSPTVRDFEVELATARRTRPHRAREIHDNVGHQLTRFASNRSPARGSRRRAQGCRRFRRCQTHG